jgi:shikimate dehydrogenase
VTALYAVLGRPVSASRSPALHNAWFRALGMDATYVAVEVPAGNDDEAVAIARTLGLAGANVTAPLKRAVARAVDHLEGDAAIVSAVNLLVRDGERWIGANTDGAGFLLAMQDVGESIAGRRAAVVGCGGAGAAVALALARSGVAQLELVNRTPEPARDLAERLRRAVPTQRVEIRPLTRDAVRSADLAVIAVPVELDLLAPSAPATWVDLRYGPEPATSVRARLEGHRVHDGSGLLLRQAALSFERWTGRPPPLLDPAAT